MIQLVLAAIFLFAGGAKLFMSSEELTKDIDLPASFLRFIGVCEVFGALGLILPGLVGLQRRLTPIAAGGLGVIMIGAVAITLAVLGVVAAMFPLVVGLFAALVALERRSWLAN
jgi:hypothetical protein